MVKVQNQSVDVTETVESQNNAIEDLNAMLGVMS